MQNGLCTNLRKWIGASRPAIAAMLLVFSGCGGGDSGGSNSPGALSAEAILSTPTPAVAGWSQFVYPTSGQLSVDSAHPFQWSSVPGAQAYQLQVGTSIGANDVYDSGAITATSVQMPRLPPTGPVYARVRVIPTGWSTATPSDYPRGIYVTFSLDANVSGAVFTAPAPGGTLDADTPIAWQADPLARNYRLTIGSTAGGSDLLDTGTILSTLRVVPGLPHGATLYATLYTSYSGNLTRSRSLSFVVGNPATSTAGMISVARSVGAVVRGMADSDNQPYGGTPLLGVAASEGDVVADCTAFANTMLAQLADANVQLQSRFLAVCFNPNSFDCHALVEVLDPDTQRWITIDPTFGLYALNAQGQPATSGDLTSAVRSMAFTELSYVYLTNAGDAYARAYYIDYPLLFLDLYQPDGSTLVQPSPASLEPYFDLMGPAVNAAANGYYAVQCASGAANATANWDGSDQSLPCTNGFTPILWGINVSVIAANASAIAIWRTHRFVF
jgi:hypothetical protein